jgi:hypothetical protein
LYSSPSSLILYLFELENKINFYLFFKIKFIIIFFIYYITQIIKWCYDSNYHFSIKISPFQAMYGYSSPNTEMALPETRE